MKEVIYVNVPKDPRLAIPLDQRTTDLLDYMTNPTIKCFGERSPKKTVEWLLSLRGENAKGGTYLRRCDDENPDVYAITYDSKNLEIVVWDHMDKTIWGVVLSKLDNKPNGGVRVFRGDPIIFYFPLDHLIDSVQDMIMSEVYALYPNARAPDIKYETKVQ